MLGCESTGRAPASSVTGGHPRGKRSRGSHRQLSGRAQFRDSKSRGCWRHGRDRRRPRPRAAGRRRDRSPPLVVRASWRSTRPNRSLSRRRRLAPAGRRECERRAGRRMAAAVGSFGRPGRAAPNDARLGNRRCARAATADVRCASIASIDIADVRRARVRQRAADVRNLTRRGPGATTKTAERPAAQPADRCRSGRARADRGSGRWPHRARPGRWIVQQQDHLVTGRERVLRKHPADRAVDHLVRQAGNRGEIEIAAQASRARSRAVRRPRPPGVRHKARSARPRSPPRRPASWRRRDRARHRASATPGKRSHSRAVRRAPSCATPRARERAGGDRLGQARCRPSRARLRARGHAAAAPRRATQPPRRPRDNRVSALSARSRSRYSARAVSMR